MNIVNKYEKSAPSTQNALDIFKGEWTSQLPEPYANLNAGKLQLFDDSRIKWAIEVMGGSIKDRIILELGPLEGGHAYMLQRFGAQSITSIEANTHAYLRCLIIKNFLELNKVRFIYGNFVEFLRLNQIKFDVVIASGVLYHMTNPAELIELLSRTTDKLFIWTHYYDYNLIVRKHPDNCKRFTGCINSDHAGFKHTLYRQEYMEALNSSSFCGGSNQFSYWMDRNELLGCLRYFGFDNIKIGFDEPDHPNGPAFALVAIRNQKDSAVKHGIQCCREKGVVYTAKKLMRFIRR